MGVIVSHTHADGAELGVEAFGPVVAGQRPAGERRERREEVDLRHERIGRARLLPLFQERLPRGGQRVNAVGRLDLGSEGLLLFTNDTRWADRILDPKAPFYLRLRDLAVLGYFTSEAGSNQELRYLPVPGKFESNVDIKTWPYQVVI